MKVSTNRIFTLAGLFLSTTTITTMAQTGPSLCKEEIAALETCAEGVVTGGSASANEEDLLGQCTDERNNMMECLGAASPDVNNPGDVTIPPSDSLLGCFVHVALYDGCVVATNATSATTTCPLTCGIDGPDQTCGDYDAGYCERKGCCTACSQFLDSYDACVADAGQCSLSDPQCIGGSSATTLVAMNGLSLIAAGVVGTMVMAFL